MLFDSTQEIGVVKPDEVFEANRDKLIGIHHVKFELGAGGRIRKGVRDVGEHAHVTQTTRRSFEIIVVYGGTHLQTAGGGDVLLGKPLAAR